MGQTISWVMGGDKNRRKDKVQNLDDSGQAAFKVYGRESKKTKVKNTQIVKTLNSLSQL